MNASEKSLRDRGEQSRLLDLAFDASSLRDRHGVIVLRNQGAEKLIVGALLASLLLGRATLASGSFDVMALFRWLLGAVLMLAVYKLIFRGR